MGLSRGCRFAVDGNADNRSCCGAVLDAGVVPSASHSGDVCVRPGPCVGGLSPSGGGWEPSSGSVPDPQDPGILAPPHGAREDIVGCAAAPT